jgi:hypothetical protein
MYYAVIELARTIFSGIEIHISVVVWSIHGIRHNLYGYDCSRRLKSSPEFLSNVITIVQLTTDIATNIFINVRMHVADI